MLFRLQILLVNVLSHYGLYLATVRIHMDLVLVALPIHGVTEIDWSLSSSFDDFAS